VEKRISKYTVKDFGRPQNVAEEQESVEKRV